MWTRTLSANQLDRTTWPALSDACLLARRGGHTVKENAPIPILLRHSLEAGTASLGFCRDGREQKQRDRDEIQAFRHGRFSLPVEIMARRGR